MDQKNYTVVHLSMWIGALAGMMVPYLIGNWPSDAKGWTIFGLQVIMWAGGSINSYFGKDKTQQ